LTKLKPGTWYVPEEELKPCPFCGSKANLGETEGCDWAIQCSGCDAFFMDDMLWHVEDYDGKQNVIDKWNKRNK